MIPIYSSALKDNEVNVTDLPMPRILGEGEEEPVEVWAMGAGVTHYMLPAAGSPLICHYTYCNEQSAINAAKRNGIRNYSPYPMLLSRAKEWARVCGKTWLCSVDESYTVIETWRVG